MDFHHIKAPFKSEEIKMGLSTVTNSTQIWLLLNSWCLTNFFEYFPSYKKKRPVFSEMVPLLLVCKCVLQNLCSTCGHNEKTGATINMYLNHV